MTLSSLFGIKYVSTNMGLTFTLNTGMILNAELRYLRRKKTKGCNYIYQNATSNIQSVCVCNVDDVSSGIRR